MMPAALMALVGAAGGAQLARMVAPWDYRALFEQVSGETKADPNGPIGADELHAIAIHESRLNAARIGPVNEDGSADYGLMQINAANLTADELASGAWRDPLFSIRRAARILLANRAEARAHGHALGFLDELAAYNAGLSTRFPGRPKLDARGAYINQQYVREVATWYAVVVAASFAPIQKVTNV